MRAALIAVLACAACASARDVGAIDAGDGGGEDDATVDAGDDDAAADAGGDGAIDAPAIDAPAIDAPAIDAPAVDAAIDATPIDGPPIDAPGCTSPTWHDVLGNGGFESGIVPWTQTTTIIRTAAMMPFAPHAGTFAAEFGASNNANDVLVQTVTIPATATGLRVRGFECHVTEDPIADTDSFVATLETPAGNVLETLESITNSDVLPFCAWTSFTWTAAGGHPGETIVLRFRGRTSLLLLTRFIVDSLALEWLGCP